VRSVRGPRDRSETDVQRRLEDARGGGDVRAEEPDAEAPEDADRAEACAVAPRRLDRGRPVDPQADPGGGDPPAAVPGDEYDRRVRKTGGPRSSSCLASVVERPPTSTPAMRTALRDGVGRARKRPGDGQARCEDEENRRRATRRIRCALLARFRRAAYWAGVDRAEVAKEPWMLASAYATRLAH
jgi:hypothetical protein